MRASAMLASGMLASGARCIGGPVPAFGRAMDHAGLRKRTAQFAKEISRFAKPLLKSIDTLDSARQLRRAATGVAANYRAAGVARSHAEFLAKIGVVHEEADEAAFWLQHLRDTDVPIDRQLLLEAIELTNIFRASCETGRRHSRERPRRSGDRPHDTT